jgi:hypothetical protein
MTTVDVTRRANEQLLQNVRDEIEAEVRHRPDSDLTPSDRYEALVRLEQRLLRELGLVRRRTPR